MLLEQWARRQSDGESIFREEITVFVGAGAERFVAHRGSLTKSSPLFQATLSSRWKESRETKVHLPDQDPIAFSIYLNWLYGGFVALLQDGEEIVTWMDEEGKQLEYPGDRFKRLIQSYILGAYIQDDEFCNSIVNSYFELSKATEDCPGVDECNLAFDQLIDTSPMRLLVLHDVTFTLHHRCLVPMIDHFRAEFVRAMALVAVQDMYKQRNCPEHRGRCYYHVHAEGKECEATE